MNCGLTRLSAGLPPSKPREETQGPSQLTPPEHQRTIAARFEHLRVFADPGTPCPVRGSACQRINGPSLRHDPTSLRAVLV